MSCQKESKPQKYTSVPSPPHLLKIFTTKVTHNQLTLYIVSRTFVANGEELGGLVGDFWEGLVYYPKREQVCGVKTQISLKSKLSPKVCRYPSGYFFCPLFFLAFKTYVVDFDLLYNVLNEVISAGHIQCRPWLADRWLLIDVLEDRWHGVIVICTRDEKLMMVRLVTRSINKYETPRDGVKAWLLNCM